MILRLLFLGFFIFSQTALATEASQFQGRDAGEKKIEARMLGPKQVFSFGGYFGSTSVFPPSTLPDLLGSYSGFGQTRTFKNGAPNALNFLLYHLAFYQFAQEVPGACIKTDLRFNPQLQATLEPLCSWPDKSAKRREYLERLWVNVMGFEAPSEEFEAWADFFLNSSYSEKPAQKVIPAMVRAMLLNPHFLLRK